MTSKHRNRQTLVVLDCSSEGWVNFRNWQVNVRNGLWLPCWREVTHDALTHSTISHCVLVISCDLWLHACCALCLRRALRKHTLLPVYLMKVWTTDMLCLDLPHASFSTASGLLRYVCWAVMLWWCFCKFKGLFTFSSVLAVNTTKSAQTSFLDVIFASQQECKLSHLWVVFVKI